MRKVYVDPFLSRPPAGWRRRADLLVLAIACFAMAFLIALLSVSAFSQARIRLVTLSWDDNSDAEVGYRVYKIRPDGLPPERRLTLPPGTTSVKFIEAIPGHHCYYVVAFNAAGETSPTATVCTELLPPTRLILTDEETELTRQPD
jgi:hypothetical protein